MRGEHDLSAYCLQDENSSQLDSDSMRIVPHDGRDGRLARTEGQEQRHEQQLQVADAVGGFSVHGRWAAGSEGAEAGAARNGRGMGGRGSYQEGYEGGGNKDGDEHRDHEDNDGFEDADDGEENARHTSACFEGRQRFASSLKQTRDPSGWEGLTDDAAVDGSRSFGDMFEANRGGNHACTPSLFPHHFEQHTTNSRNNTNMHADMRERVGAGGAGGRQDAKYARGNPVFFPGTDDSSVAGGGRGDSARGGGAGDDRMNVFPSPITPTTATAYPVRSGIGNRRRSSGVSEEILTAGARASAEEAARASSGAEQPTSTIEGKPILAAENFRELRSDGGKREERALTLGPEEPTPTNGGARIVSTSATGGPIGYYGVQQTWQKQHFQPQTTGITSRASTPGMYVGELEASHPFGVAAGVEGEVSPASVERFGPNTNNPPTPASSYSSPGNINRGSGDRDSSFRSGRFSGGVSSSLPDGSASLSPPRHRATVADVQEAFERADTRLAKGQDQSESGDGGNAAKGTPQRGGNASHGQLRVAVSATSVGQAEKLSSNTPIPSGYEEEVSVCNNWSWVLHSGTFGGGTSS